MKLTLDIFGGLAAGIRRQPFVVNSDVLGEELLKELNQLVEEVLKTPTIEPQYASKMRDGMSYHLTIEDAGSIKQIRQEDLQKSDAFKNLISWMKLHRT